MTMPLSNNAGGSAQKYDVVAELGQGGMSVIHLAAARGLGNVQKLVVLKSIRPELTNNDKVQQMFMDEARLATQLTHPNIVQTYEVVMISGRPVIVMEYMEGKSFSALLRRAGESGGLALAMQLRIVSETLSGLDYAHNLTDYEGNQAGVVHRDVSPQNVFVTYDGHVKILDFGIAKARENSAHTEIGELKGKIRYMAPEQMEGSPNLDRRADVYAVGVMLWEALARQRLWLNVPDAQIFRTVLNKSLPSPRSANPEVNERLEAICMKALAHDPEQRYESCAQMQFELDQAAEDLGLRASSKEIGRLLKILFSEVRTTIRVAIDQKLKTAASQPNLSDSQRFLQADSLLGPTSNPSPQTGGGVTMTQYGRKRSPWLVLLLLAALAAAGTALIPYKNLVLESFAHRRAVPPAAAADKPTPAPSPSPDPNIGVRLSAAPDRAKLYLDGKLLPANPFVGELPTDKAPHELRAEASGYVTQSVALWLTGTSDITVNLALDAMPSPAARGKSAARPRPPRLTAAASAPSKAPAPVDCNNPFTIDAAGIRHVRPECT
jgi:serine/threonine protein kinase